MCGVAALIADKPSDLVMVQSMCDIVRHRGPDGAGYAFFDEGLIPRTAGCKDTPLAIYETPTRYAPKVTLPGMSPSAARAALGHRRLAIVDTSPLGHQPMCSQDGRFWSALEAARAGMRPSSA